MERWRELGERAAAGREQVEGARASEPRRPVSEMRHPDEWMPTVPVELMAPAAVQAASAVPSAGLQHHQLRGPHTAYRERLDGLLQQQHTR